MTKEPAGPCPDADGFQLEEAVAPPEVPGVLVAVIEHRPVGRWPEDHEVSGGRCACGARVLYERRPGLYARLSTSPKLRIPWPAPRRWRGRA